MSCLCNPIVFFLARLADACGDAPRRVRRNSEPRAKPLESLARLGSVFFPPMVDDDGDGFAGRDPGAGSVVTGNWAERRPVRSCRYILRSAARASHAAADVGHREVGTELGHQAICRDDRIVPASVAPAEHIDVLIGQRAEQGRPAARILFREDAAFVLTHACSLPMIAADAADGLGSVDI